MTIIPAGLSFAILALGAFAQSPASDRDRLIGAWQLVALAAPAPDGKLSISHPIGMLVYTRDGHMSVQLMYPASENSISNEYVLNGYEASFGSYEIDEKRHILTHHVQGANTRGLLVGKSLPRAYEFDAQGNLILRSTRPDEHWSVTWKRY